jgi:hypothetical protein
MKMAVVAAMKRKMAVHLFLYKFFILTAIKKKMAGSFLSLLP